MPKRPTAVTVIGWFWRGGGILGMVLAFPLALLGEEWFREYSVDAFWRLPTAFLFLYCFLTSLLGLLCGNGILKGRNWARVLAVVYCLVATLVAGVMYQGHPLYWVNLIGNSVFSVIMWFFLFRPGATHYFRGSDLQEGQGAA